MRFVVANPNLPASYRRDTERWGLAIARACTLAYRACAKLIDSRGKTDIARSGKFGARWQEGLKVLTLPRQGFSIENQIIIGHDQIGARLFEYGGTVRGKPLLWIPLSFSNAKGRKAREYPGGLFRVNRRGKSPLLLSRIDKKPKYVGKRQVTIRQRWHIRDISADVMTHSFIPFYNRDLK